MKRLTAVTAFVLALIMLFSGSSFAAELCFAPLFAERSDSLDYSTSLAPKAYLSPSDLISLLLEGKETVSDAEGKYLDDYFEGYLSYSSALPAELISVQKDQNKITVTAKPYVYESDDNRKITYLPTAVYDGGNKYDITVSNNVGTLTFESSATDLITVYYTGSIDLPISVANELLNYAFRDLAKATSSSEEMKKYGEALKEYEKYLVSLEKYETDTEKYEAYLAAKSLYDDALAKYKEYLKEVKEYEDKADIYDKYLKDLSTYNSDMEKYKADYVVYEQNRKDYQSFVTAQTSIRTAMMAMESIYMTPSNNVSSLYVTLQNKELVAMFEKYQGLLVTNFGVKKEDIHYLTVYSNRLNELLREYAKQRKISDEAAFIFYKQNYKEISTLFNGLYEKMDSILNPTIFNLVCGKLELEYGDDAERKKMRLKNVLSQIYLVCLCLDDTETVQKTWMFYRDDGDPHEYFFSDLLAQEIIITDTNSSDPSDLVWPTTVEPMDPPTLPTRPTEVEKPIPPVAVTKPTPPKKVNKPTLPTEVQKPERPDDFDAELVNRTESILGLALSEREEFKTDPSVDLTISTNISLQKNDLPTLTVYDTSGNIVATLTSMDQLDSIEQPAQTYCDHVCEYSFIGYSSSPTENIPLPAVLTENISAYAIYESKIRSYNVTFSVNGVDTVVPTPAGSLPSFGSADPKMPSDSLYDYTFARWDTPLKLVWEDAHYSAVFDKSDRIFDITFVYKDKTVTQKYVRGQGLSRAPIPPSSYVEGIYFYEFDGWDSELINAISDKTYTAVYKKTPLATAQSNELTLTDTPTEYILSGKGTVFSVSELAALANANGKTIRIVFEDYDTEISLSLDAISSLVTRKGNWITLLTAGEGSTGSIGFSVSKEDGNTISISGDIRLSFPHKYKNDKNIFVREHLTDELYSDNIHSISKDGITSVIATANRRYETIRKFSLTVEDVENGTVFTDTTVFTENDTVTIYAYPNANYLLDGITVTIVETGETKQISEGEAFTMPASDVTVSATFTPIEYTITFVYHEKTESFKYIFGDTPTQPSITLSFIEGDLFYTFIGWTTPISVVTGDTTYTAKYYSISKAEAPDPEEPPIKAMDSIYKKYVVPAIVIAVILLILLISLPIVLTVTVIIPRIKKRGAKAPRKKKEKRCKEK